MEENCTALDVPCLQADIEDVFLNSHLYPPTQDQYWLDGALLVAVSSLGVLLNSFMVLCLPCSTPFVDDSILRLLSGVDICLLSILLLRRIPPVFLDSQFLLEMFPNILLYIPAVEAGISTLSSFLFLIFVARRHLRQVEGKNYRCYNVILFSLVLALVVATPALFEVKLKSMTREEIANLIDLKNTTMRVSEENLVIIHSDMYHQKTYEDMFRLLFNFITSQVGVIWILPIIFFHSQNVYKIKKKHRKNRDMLTPIISIFFIVFSIPQLIVFLRSILLYKPLPLLIRIAGFCLACIASLKICIILTFDKSLRRCLSPYCTRARIAVPRDDGPF